MKKLFTRLISYPVLFLLMIPAYIYGRSILISQDTTYTVFNSMLTVNIVIVFFIIGTAIDKYTKNMPKWKGWGIWAVGTLLMILMFKYVGGLETWW